MFPHKSVRSRRHCLMPQLRLQRLFDILVLVASFPMLANATSSIWDLEYSCEPVGEVSTVTFQNPYPEPANITVIVNWGPYTEEHQCSLGISEQLSLNFTYPQPPAGGEMMLKERREYHNRSFEFISKGRLRSIKHEKCVMSNDGILQGNCCRPPPSFRAFPIADFARGGMFEKYRNRNRKTSWSIERWSGDAGGRDGRDDGIVIGRRGSFTDPIAIAVAVLTLLNMKQH